MNGAEQTQEAPKFFILDKQTAKAGNFEALRGREVSGHFVDDGVSIQHTVKVGDVIEIKEVVEDGVVIETPTEGYPGRGLYYLVKWAELEKIPVSVKEVSI